MEYHAFERLQSRHQASAIGFSQVDIDLQNLTAKLSCPQGCKHVAALLLNGIVPPRFLVAKLLTEDRVALCIGNSSALVPVQSPGNAEQLCQLWLELIWRASLYQEQQCPQPTLCSLQTASPTHGNL